LNSIPNTHQSNAVRRSDQRAGAISAF